MRRTRKKCPALRCRGRNVHERSGGAMMTMPAGPAAPPVHPPPDPHTDRPLIVCLALALVLGLAAGTQYVAWRLHYHPGLGAPLAVLSADTGRMLRRPGVPAAGRAA